MLSILVEFFYSFCEPIQNPGREVDGTFVSKESSKVALMDCSSYIVVIVRGNTVISNGFLIKSNVSSFTSEI
jgi:hypothetical protein